MYWINKFYPFSQLIWSNRLTTQSSGECWTHTWPWLCTWHHTMKCITHTKNALSPFAHVTYSFDRLSIEHKPFFSAYIKPHFSSFARAIKLIKIPYFKYGNLALCYRCTTLAILLNTLSLNSNWLFNFKQNTQSIHYHL